MTKAVTPPTGAEYLICKYGMYYRPNAQGYTGSVAEAGRYTLAEAIRHSHPNGPDGPRDGMSYRAVTPADERAPSMSDEIRAQVAKLYCAAGCSCCRNDDAWDEASNRLGELLGVPRYEDDSGVDWYAARDGART